MVQDWPATWLGERLVYSFDKPRPDGSWQLTLTPLELLDRLARFIPAPRRHLHRYHGVFAAHAALRAQVAARAGQAIMAPPSSPEDLAVLIVPYCSTSRRRGIAGNSCQHGNPATTPKGFGNG